MKKHISPSCQVRQFDRHGTALHFSLRAHRQQGKKDKHFEKDRRKNVFTRAATDTPAFKNSTNEKILLFPGNGKNLTNKIVCGT